MDGRRFQRLAVYVEVDISDLKWIGVEIVAVVVAVLVFVIRREKAVYPMTFELDTCTEGYGGGGGGGRLEWYHTGSNGCISCEMNPQHWNRNPCSQGSFLVEIEGSFNQCSRRIWIFGISGQQGRIRLLQMDKKQ